MSSNNDERREELDKYFEPGIEDSPDYKFRSKDQLMSIQIDLYIADAENNCTATRMHSHGHYNKNHPESKSPISFMIYEVVFNAAREAIRQTMDRIDANPAVLIQEALKLHRVELLQMCAGVDIGEILANGDHPENPIDNDDAPDRTEGGMFQ